MANSNRDVWDSCRNSREAADGAGRHEVPFDKLRAGFRLRNPFASRSDGFAQDDNFCLVNVQLANVRLRFLCRSQQYLADERIGGLRYQHGYGVGDVVGLQHLVGILARVRAQSGLG